MEVIFKKAAWIRFQTSTRRYYAECFFKYRLVDKFDTSVPYGSFEYVRPGLYIYEYRHIKNAQDIIIVIMTIVSGNKLWIH